MNKCKKCLDVKNEWFSSIARNWNPIKNKFKTRFNSVFGEGEFDKAYINGEINCNWEGKCNYCKTKYWIDK